MGFPREVAKVSPNKEERLIGQSGYGGRKCRWADQGEGRCKGTVVEGTW